MKDKLRNIYRNIMALISSVSPTATSEFYYFSKFKRKINLKKPKTFNEKLMYLKLKEYEKNDLVTKCADKYKVREYVQECGLKEILNDLLGVYNNADEIDFNKLPNKFVLKCNHGAGFNIICKDKNKLDYKKTRNTLNKWMKIDYWKYVAEMQYKKIDKKIICEKYLESKGNDSIEDYKIYCFNGKPLFCMVCIGRNLGKPTYYFLDTNWKILKINPAGKNAKDDLIIPKPKSIDKMYEYAEILAKPFKFVRVDFYDYMDKPIFGELTFTPAGCIDTNYIDDWDNKLGEMLKV